MILQVCSGVVASGEAYELGVFLASYHAHSSIFLNSLKEQAAKRELAEKIAKEFKGVKITPIKKEDGEQNATNG